MNAVRLAINDNSQNLQVFVFLQHLFDYVHIVDFKSGLLLRV